jgi:hypothetical protein
MEDGCLFNCAVYVVAFMGASVLAIGALAKLVVELA